MFPMCAILKQMVMDTGYKSDHTVFPVFTKSYVLCMALLFVSQQLVSLSLKY